jgi:hypothetical protein
MFAPQHPLRRISDDVLQDTDPARAGKRPFEWRRNFNITNFLLLNPRVVVSYDLNDVNFFAQFGEAPRSAPLVNAGPGKSVSIQGSVELSVFGDRFVQTRRAPGDDRALLEAFSPKGRLQVAILPCDPYQGNEIFGPGTYPGMLCSWDPSIEKDTLTLELRAPAAAIAEIADALQSGKAGALGLHVGVHVFTYEVDDALREPHHSQTFLVPEDGAAAALTRIRTLPAPEPEPPDEDLDATTSIEQPPTTRSALSRQVSDLTSLATPLWTIAGILLLLWVTR